MERITSVSGYIEKKPNWSEALLLLRDIILASPVEECMKWSAPAYTFNSENIVGLAAFKIMLGSGFIKVYF